MQSKLIALSLMSITLIGCSESMLTAGNSAKGFINSTISSTKELVGLGEIDPTVQIVGKHIKEFESNADQLDTKMDLARMRVEEHIPIQVRPLEAYSNALLQRLVRGWQGQKLAAEVKLIASSSVNAQVRENHTIFLPLGLYSNTLALSEDELAAVLAHELAHIIAGHNQNRDVVDVLNLYNKVSQLKTRRDFEKGRTLEDRYLSQTSDLDRESWIFNRLVVPNWSRKDESEADALGIDLLANAGFSHKQWPACSKKLRVWVPSKPKTWRVILTSWRSLSRLRMEILHLIESQESNFSRPA